MTLNVIAPAILLGSAALTVGLSFLPCKSALCVEEFHPGSTHAHIAHFYGLVASVGCILLLRALIPAVRCVCETHISSRVLPVVGKRLSVGGLGLTIWITGLTFAVTPIWWQDVWDFYEARGDTVDYTVGTLRLTLLALSGHWCDILAGLTVLAVGRTSVLLKLLQLHNSTVLFAHKILAYGLGVATVFHMVSFYSWLPTFALAPTDKKREAFNIDNPTVSVPDAEKRGVYSFTVLATGMLSFVMLCIITITSLPAIRRRSYNTFYYSHIICSLLFFILICLHASTDFYLLLPGLALWLVDWTSRFRWLFKKDTCAKVSQEGEGWYKIKLNNHGSQGAVISPLETYYINFPTISKAQCHAFTASAAGSSPEFLFRKVQGKKQKKLDREWTWKTASMIQSCGEEADVKIRIEGPYVCGIGALGAATDVLCIVGGTGISGALSIARWWIDTRAAPANRFRLVWTVRGREAAQLSEFERLREYATSHPNFETVQHISGEGSGRLDARQAMVDFFSGGEKKQDARDGSGFVYVSGPEGLLDSAETSIVQLRKQSKKDPEASLAKVRDLNWYIARWDV